MAYPITSIPNADLATTDLTVASTDSTLITRICAPDLLTQVQKDAIEAVDATAQANAYKLPVASVVALAQEILYARLPVGVLGVNLTSDELTDAYRLLERLYKTDADLIAPASLRLTLTEMERVFSLGERNVYTVPQVKAILLA